MAHNNPFCTLIGWLNKRCSGVQATRPELPIQLREATHNLTNEVMRLQGQVLKVRQSADDLSELIEHMGSKK